MSLHLTECRKIIEGVFCRPDLPEELRHKFSEWMLAHENDHTLQQVMLEMWANLHDDPSEVSSDGLHRLLNDIKLLEGNSSKASRHGRIARYCAAAAITAVMFTAGWLASGAWFGNDNTEPTTILVTAPGSTGHHILPDGTEVWLNSESKLCYTGNLDGAIRQVSLKGEAYFDVAQNKVSPFQVVMDSLQVEVTGTAFDAINYPFAPEQVALQRGSVNVTGKSSGMAVTLSPDQIVTRRRGTSEISVGSADCDNYCGWMARRITFDNRRLYDILTILERRYAVSITVGPHVDLEKRLSLTIGGETFDETTRLIERLVPIRFETSGNTVTVTICRRNARS